MSLPVRTQRALQHFKMVSGLPGDVIELGVHTGVTSIALASYIKANDINKVVYSCDTYEGLPWGEKNSPLQKGECRTPYDQFWAAVEEADVTSIIKPVIGLVQDTLYTKLPDGKFCFAFMDMDLYDATSFATRYLQPRITLGGVMGYHDYRFERCPGIERVVDTEVDKRRFVMFGDHASNCAWFQKVMK